MSKRNDDDFASTMTRLTFGLLGQAFVGLARLAGAGVDHASGVRYGNCAICGAKVRYTATGQKGGVLLCNECLEYLEFVTQSEPYETHDASYVMPGMDKTLRQLGCTSGKHKVYVRNGKVLVHCDAFEAVGRENAMHLAWDYNPFTGEVTGLHQRHDNMNG